jgi:hypothetical protein
MTLMLINTTGAAESGSLRFSNNDGSPLTVTPVGGVAGSSFAYNIPAGGFFVFRTDGSPSQINVGSAQAVPNPSSTSPVGAGIFSFTQNGILVTESGIPSAIVTTHARIFVDATSGHNTGLAIANPGATPLRLTINLFHRNGVTLLGANSVDLSPNGHTARFVSELLPAITLPSGFTGVLDIAAANPFAALTLRSLANTRGDVLLATFPTADLTRPAPSPILFPQIADGGGFLTQFILLSTGPLATPQLSLFGDDGSAVPLGKGDRATP